MARFLYVGDPREDKRVGEPDETSIAGLTFRRDKPTQVDDERLVSKLRNNTHFREVRLGRPPAQKDIADEQGSA